MNDNVDTSYFRDSLLNYLENYHPELFAEKHLIDVRCERAAMTFEQVRLQGKDVFSAMGLAHEVLFAGLRFSKFVMIVSILEANFEQISSERLRKTALTLLPLCESVFERYELADDFEQSPEYKRCTFELIGLIDIYFQDHGLQ